MFTFAWALLFQTINILVFSYKVFTPFYTGSCAQGKYNFEHINERCSLLAEVSHDKNERFLPRRERPLLAGNERCSRLCRKFPDLDFFCLLYLDMSLRETQYMLL